MENRVGPPPGKLARRVGLFVVIAAGSLGALGVVAYLGAPALLAILPEGVADFLAYLAVAACVVAYATGYPVYRLGRWVYGRWRPGRLAPRSWRLGNVIWLVSLPVGLFLTFLLRGLLALQAFFGPAGPEGIRIADPARAVADARRMMRQGPPSYVKPEDLPESLRLAGLRWGLVAHDHVSLVLGATPDYQAGARIWSVDAPGTHGDQRTKYKDVFFYIFDKERPESPTNVP